MTILELGLEPLQSGGEGLEETELLFLVLVRILGVRTGAVEYALFHGLEVVLVAYNSCW